MTWPQARLVTRLLRNAKKEKQRETDTTLRAALAEVRGYPDIESTNPEVALSDVRLEQP
jgi:hypothetical protein